MWERIGRKLRDLRSVHNVEALNSCVNSLCELPITDPVNSTHHAASLTTPPSRSLPSDTTTLIPHA